ncbi:hypothetical protein BDV96DRAFT_524740 [Lophiotrema nucula]|uniref:USP domain-containing protein n=1 Tax=Lophiotrema nucula TaxID=690887 RepID=A0A6A5Z0Q7_9PLEO|nr:hypothetical protein BDV96DRAFT_524740 [Lophiotrema nucula]
MSQRDHEVMESVSPANHVPASPLRRDSLEDADASKTRKRPRLDNEGADNQTMSTDPAAASSAAPPTEQAVEMTIRSQPSSAAQPADDADVSNGSTAHTASANGAMDSAAETVETLPTSPGSEAPESPPVLAVDDDDVEEDMDGFSRADASYVSIEYDEEETFLRFPFTQGHHGNYMSAIRTVVQHFQGSNALDGTVLPQVTLWLNSFPNRPSQYKGYFLDKIQFWDEVAALAQKVLLRRYPFGDSFAVEGQLEEDTIRDFLLSYLKLCALLFKVDTLMLRRYPRDGDYDGPLLTFKHIRQVSTVFRPEKPQVFGLLSKEYNADIGSIQMALLQQFLSGSSSGVEPLLDFLDAACETVGPPLKPTIAVWATQLFNALGWSLLEVSDTEIDVDRHQIFRKVLRYVRAYDVDIQQPAKVADVGVGKELLIHFAALLENICLWDAKVAIELAEEHLDFGDPVSPTTASEDGRIESQLEAYRAHPDQIPILVSNAWKFKLLRKYMEKGKMELRVMSIGTMDGCLVEIWKEHHTSPLATNHPVMQYLAEFLLRTRVVNYIISDKSHPQLISRSGNIVGFLVVTHRYTESQTDAIWNTVSKSQDPRVVTATMAMLRGIVNLMGGPELVYICTKLYDLPIESLNLDILRFMREIFQRTQHLYVDWSTAETKARPWNVMIRVIEDTFPTRESTKMSSALHTEACEQLRAMSVAIAPQERQRIFGDLAAKIAGRSEKATGSVRAMSLLCSTNIYGEMGFFKQNLDLTRKILEELCAFVDTEKQLEIHVSQPLALQFWLDIFSVLLHRVPESIPEDLYLDILDHLIGKHALNNYVRDLAWSRLTEAARYKADNEICRQLISSYIPKFEPCYFTNGLFEFVATMHLPITRRKVSTDEGDKSSLQIPGADLLWRMVLTAPPNTIEDRSAKTLASRYIDIVSESGVSLEEVEDAHIALVEQCTDELISSYNILRGKAEDRKPSVSLSDIMDIEIPDDNRQQTELRFCRTLLFEKLLLNMIRTRSEFSRSRRSDSKVEPLEADMVLGDGVEIKYQAAGSGQQSILIGAENTLQDLYSRLCQATGFSKINLFSGGKLLTLDSHGSKTITDLGGLGGLLLVQKAGGSETTRPVPDGNATCSVFESSILKHFDELFACMDADDLISEKLFQFLSHFSFRDSICEGIIAGTASTDDVFPPGRIFQATYAAHALQYRLRDQLRKGALDENFLANSVSCLDAALLNDGLISQSLTGRHELDLAAALVVVLLEFLKERPSQETSLRYFSDETRLVDRLLHILTIALRADHENPALACSCYATILEGALHSKKIWNVFMTREDVPALHLRLLLTDPRKILRDQITLSIASLCGGSLPSTSPLTSADTAQQFWSIISAVLPEAVKYPGQAQQLFTIAEQVFRSHDENSRDEEALRSSLTVWSDLLLRYKHDEFVGRNEIDFVVLGFTRLLLSCIPSLKSYKKPLNAGPLMEQLFRKFLFVPQVVEIDDERPADVGLPVLESKTRTELYDLMLALAEDRSSYSTLLKLAESLEDVEENLSLKSFAVERSNEIRSCTGYVGLFNPRAICYMNSLLTQLFMNVNFRKFMLSLNVADMTSQRLLSETQRLFASMQNSYRKAADPRDFAQCVKGLDSLPIDINIQMDADEFYNLLFDQWEGQMLSAEAKQQFRSFYGGQTVNQIKSKECEHVSERVESFFVVQCDVQGKANLQDSLQAFVEGDVMEGDNKYKCESCGGKFVDAVKRTCLKDVPDNLIFHLKRFDFDLVDMRRAKINDHFEFPTQIDVSSYNIEHLSDPSKPRQEDVFELVGVLVHQGTSENGHYYSYIRERPCPSGSATTWVEFNDREVDYFDQQSIPYNAYGGLFDEYQRTQKQFSAYMLFYQRKTAIEKDHREYISSPTCGRPKVSINPGLEEEILKYNDMFVREYCLFDPNHSKFVRQILATLRSVNHGTCSEDHQQEAQALHIVLEHLFQVIIRQRELEYFDETIIQLRRTALSCPTCCHIALKWLASQQYALVGLYLRCTHMKVRSQMRAFLVDGLKYLREQEPTLYGAENVDTDMETGTVAPIEGILVDVVQRLREVAKESGLSARGWDDLYHTLCQLSDMGLVETAVMLNEGILYHCLQVLSMHVCARYRLDHPDIWRLVDKKKKIYNRLTELVYTLLSKTDIRLPPVSMHDDRLEKFDRHSNRFPLSLEENRTLSFFNTETVALAVLETMIEHFDYSKSEASYPGKVLQWMLETHQPKLLEHLFQTVHEGITCFQPPNSDPYVRAAMFYCVGSRSAKEVINIVDAVAKSTHELKDREGGAVRLEFFQVLLKLDNQAVFDERDPDLFLDLVLMHSRKYAYPLLIYDDDRIRRDISAHIEQLFTNTKPDEELQTSQLKYKYDSVRNIVRDTNKRLVLEHNNGTPRAYMDPMIKTNEFLIGVLHQFFNSEEPRMVQLKRQGDASLLNQYENDVYPRVQLEAWAHDDGTPISTGEGYEQSDYGSDSDDGLDP